MEEKQQNLELIKKHLKFLKHTKETELRIFSPGDISNRIYIISDHEKLPEILINSKEDLAFGVHERFEGGINDENVTHMRYIVIDIDTKDPIIIEETEMKLKGANLHWGAKIFTGQKGYHYYIPIVTIEGNEKIKETLENCKHYFIKILNLPVDPRCFNPSRVFRVWGSLNKGKLVEVIELKENIPEVNTAEKIPQRPESENITTVNKDFHYRNQVLDDFPLFEALYKDPKLLPIKQGTNFNDVIVKNIAAYIQKKNTRNITPWLTLMKLKGHPISNLTNWLKKPRFFNPFEIISNIRAHYPELYKEYCAPMKQISSHSLSYIEDDEMKWEELKRTHRMVNSFIINKQYKFESNIIAIDEGKVVIKLAKVYQSITDPNQYYNVYFDELEFKKGLSRVRREELNVNYIGEINASFFVYVAIHNNVKIRIFSEEKLNNGRYLMFGTLIKFNDSYQVGNKSTVSAYSFGLILHSYENTGFGYSSLEDLYDDIKISGDDFYKYLMTEVDNIRTPAYYKTSEFWKKIYTSFIFSGCYYKGEKLNMIIVGPTGTGKTPHLNAISEKFSENKHYTGTTMSIPGLTVSFYTNPPKLGALLESVRLCAIDEFFKIFIKMDDIFQVTALNDYLDNQTVTATSGKQSMDVKCTCQVFGVTNPIRKNVKGMGVRKLMSLLDMFDYVDSDFWGRFLIVNQNKFDIEWVLDPNNMERNVIVTGINKQQFLACYDFYKSYNEVLVNIDSRRINQIVRTIQVPENIESVYKKICNRIPYLLFDGMIKWKMFCNRQTFPLIEERDYQEFYELWDELIKRWFYGQEGFNISLLFSNKEQNIIEKIKQKGSISYDDFNELCKEEELSYKDLRKRLVDMKVVKTDIDKRRIYYLNEMEILEELEDNMKDRTLGDYV